MAIDSYAAFKLYDFEVQNSDVPKSQIRHELSSRIEWMKEQQDSFYENELEGVVQRILDPEDEEDRLYGSSNSNGRKLGISPSEQTGYQPYNYAEMFRASVVSKLGGHLQNEILLDVIMGCDDWSAVTSSQVLKAYKDEHPLVKPPTYEVIIRALDRLNRVGTVHGKPRGDGLLPLWACDQHFCQDEPRGTERRATWKSLTSPGSGKSVWTA